MAATEGNQTDALVRSHQAADSPLASFTLMRPTQIIAGWTTVLDAGAVDDADNSGNDVEAPSTDADHHIKKTKGVGTLLLLRLVYDDGITSVTDPVLQVFGRAGDSGTWMRLRNRNGAVDITLATDLTVDAAWSDDLDATTVHLDNNIIDLLGCDQFTVVVKTALSATGTVTTAFVEAKVI